MRRDLGLLRPGDEIAVDLRTLTTRRTDLVADRTRQINRLRARLLEIFPALERVSTRPLVLLMVLLTGYQTPAAIGRTAAKRIELRLDITIGKSFLRALPRRRLHGPRRRFRGGAEARWSRPGRPST